MSKEGKPILYYLLKPTGKTARRGFPASPESIIASLKASSKPPRIQKYWERDNIDKLPKTNQIAAMPKKTRLAYSKRLWRSPKNEIWLSDIGNHKNGENLLMSPLSSLAKPKSFLFSILSGLEMAPLQILGQISTLSSVRPTTQKLVRQSL